MEGARPNIDKDDVASGSPGGDIRDAVLARGSIFKKNTPDFVYDKYVTGMIPGSPTHVCVRDSSSAGLKADHNTTSTSY